MDRLDRIYALKWRSDGLLADRHLLESSKLLLTGAARLHIEAAFASRLKPGVAAEYHWAVADSYISFIESGQKQLAAMLEEAKRLCL